MDRGRIVLLVCFFSYVFHCIAVFVVEWMSERMYGPKRAEES